MMKRALIISTLTVTLFLSTGPTTAAGPHQIYGSQLMTQQEMFEFHKRMRSASSPQEREQIRNAHHQQMQARANAQGFTLPDIPPTYGPCRYMQPDCMGSGYMSPGYMGPGYMGPGNMRPGYMGPGHMMPGYMGPGSYRNP